MAVIDELLAEVPDALRFRLAAEVARLRDPSLFGIQFERHIPEYLAVPGLPLRQGMRVALRGGTMADPHTITNLSGDAATILPEAGGEERTVRVGDLVPIKRFGEPVFPARGKCAARGGRAAPRPDRGREPFGPQPAQLDAQGPG